MTQELNERQQQRFVRPLPKRLTCSNCDGKKWFPSAIGEIACQVCQGSGKGAIDVEWLIEDWQRLKELEGVKESQQLGIE